MDKYAIRNNGSNLYVDESLKGETIAPSTKALFDSYNEAVKARDSLYYPKQYRIVTLSDN